MPIQVNCQCGKALNVKDALAGKAVKCPACGSAVRVPAASAPAAAAPQAPVAPAPIQPMAAAPQQTPGGTLNDIFDEEGFGHQVAAACPACGSEMAANAVLCTKCGYNVQLGTKLDGHKTAGLDIDHGELALQRAQASMAFEDKLQKEMESKAGLPWWGLALVLFVLVSGASIAVIKINAMNQATGDGDFNAMATFLMLAGVACGAVTSGGIAKIIIHSVKKDATKVQMIKTVVVTVVLLAATIGLLIGASNA